MVDPGAQLPREPATLILDLSGRADVTADLTDPAVGELSAPPGALRSLDLNQMRLAAAGAELTGQGALTFDNADLSMGLPQPVGAVDLALTGGSALLDRLGLEARSGTLLTGSDRIAETARRGKVTMLLHASDAAADGNGKLDQAWRVGSETEGSGDRGIVLPVDRTRLSVALGRDNAVHVALTDHRAAARIDQFLGRLLHFKGEGAEPAPRMTI